MDWVETEEDLAKDLLAIQGGSHEDAVLLLEDLPDEDTREEIREIMVRYCDTYDPATNTCSHFI